MEKPVMENVDNLARSHLRYSYTFTLSHLQRVQPLRVQYSPPCDLAILPIGPSSQVTQSRRPSAPDFGMTGHNLGCRV